MKKIFMVLLGAMMVCTGFAQVVQEGEAAVVYYSPKTLITLDFSYTVETQEKGKFAQYAESLLGATNGVKANQTKYELTNVRVGTRTGADYSRPHKVTAEPAIPLLLSLNEKGLLMGYNLPPSEKKASKDQTARETKSCEKTSSSSALPYPEEVLKANSLAAQANAVAKQIFHLRETRMYLINGEVEHAPADGEAMRLVLEELDRQEKQLTELFTGKTIRHTDHKIVRFDPAMETPTLFFSEENGFTEADNIDAEKVNVDIAKRIQKAVPAPEPDKKEKKKVAPELSQIVYNLPGSAEVTILYKSRTLAQNTLPIAQFGVDVPIAKDVFKGTELPVIVFCEKTGNIISISK